MKHKDKFKQTEIGLIPEDWEVKKIGNLCDITSSKRIFLNEYVSEGIPFFRSKEIILLSNNQIITNTLFISKERFKEISEKFGSPKEGDLLMTSVGTLGVPYVVKKNEMFYFKDGNLMWFKLFRPNFNNKFLYYWIKSPIGQQSLDSVSIGSTQKALTIDSIKGMKIAVPQLEEQSSIAKILSDLDSKIELNQRMNKVLEAIGQAFFKRWFVDFEFPNEEGKPYKSSSAEMVDSELGKIPKGWHFGRIEDIASVIGGGTPSTKKSEYFSNNAIAWITPKDLSNYEWKYISKGHIDITEDGLKNSGATIMPSGSILFSSRAPIGYIAIASKEFSTNQGFKSLVPKQKQYSEYLFYLMKNSASKIESIASGSTFREVSGSAVKKFGIIVPSDSMMDEFYQKMMPLSNRMFLVQKETEILVNIRDSILPKLMTGKIRPPTGD